MVIDRTTGKGCALSIAAKTVTRNLIADGIIGKQLLKRSALNALFGSGCETTEMIGYVLAGISLMN